MLDAVIVGAGPNGLAAAVVLAQEGLHVRVLEANDTPGGAARTAELTEPGFRHDLGSAVHPLAAASPLFSTLPLSEYGLAWVHPELPVAQPLGTGRAVALHRSLDDTADALGPDAATYRALIGPLATRWRPLLDDVLQPMLRLPRRPLTLARFGLPALVPAATLARAVFRTEEARALFAGNAAHARLPLTQPLTSAFGLLLAAVGHAVGWPVPRGGARAITDALVGYLECLGGEVVTGRRVERLADLPAARAVLLDVTPHQLLRMAEGTLPGRYRRALERYRLGPGTYKLDYALSEPIPWKAEACRRAGTVHVGGTLADVVRAEDAPHRGRVPDEPFLLVAQPSLDDTTRAPEGRHVAWLYAHVPTFYDGDATALIERQIERFAPGFRDVVLARHVSTPADLERQNANLIGGDLGGGAQGLWQSLKRPILSPTPYRTPLPGVYLCSSATPPGGGVHGMAGYHAAKAALADVFG